MENRGAHPAGPAAGGTTLAQLARNLNVDLREVTRTARVVLGLAPAQARDRRFELSDKQCNLIDAALEMRPQPSLRAHADVGAAPRPRAGATDRRRVSAPPGAWPAFEPDHLARPHDLQFRGLRHGIWLHPEVSDHVRVWAHLYKRLGIVLQHLAAHGRTTVVKGCRDGNRGWRRSPLGGANGMQYYLWWTPRGSRVADGLALPADAVLVRAVRHHDDHAPLEAGSLDDYLPLAAPDDLNDDIAGRPWTDAQIRFVEDERPVRLILGRPGSGKTTVLWKAVEARSGQRILYLTWSSALTNHAEERFASFAPADVEVVARDFATFVGEICGADVARQALAASRNRFDAAITRLGRDMAGPWKNRRDALHAELRAILFGRAIPGETGCAAERGIARLDDDTYRGLRGDHDGVGPKAARALLKVARFLPADGVRAVFPELVAATRAIGRLRDDELPEGFDDFDRIVVDELQDLTLLETAVVVELCRAIGRRYGRAPWLLMAGDAGQTVRPTGFDWGPLNDLLARRVGRPARFQLDEHLRCPSRIAEVVERASERYVDLEKHVRPTKQRRQDRGQHVDAHLFHVEVTDRSAGVELLERLEEADNVVVLSARNDPPSWVPERLRNSVLTPAEAKGLEYQSVCLLDLGRLLSHLRSEEQEYLVDAELDQQARRTAIDHLRVTLSRATETLACIDVAATDEERELSLALLGDAAPYSPEDLLDHFAQVDASPEERVQARTQDARLLIDSAPGRAWQRARQAFRLLGDPELPNGVSDRAVRLDARTTLLATAARLLVDGPPDGVQRHEVIKAALEAIAIAGEPLPAEPAPAIHRTGAGEQPDANEPLGAESPHPFVLASAEEHTLRELVAWSVDRSVPPFALLERALALERLQRPGGDWLRPALLPAAQALREGLNAGAADPESAEWLAETGVEAWLQLTGYTGDAPAGARVLRSKAFDTLLKAAASERGPARRKRLGRAEALLATITPDLLRLGRLREAQARPEDAAAAYERAGAHKDVLRIWRNAGAWERAVELAQGDIRADLDWLIELERLVARRPAQQNKRLRSGERDRLEKLLDTVQKRPPRKRSGNGG